eukprot:286417_1
MSQDKTLIARIFHKYGVKPIDIPVGLVVFNGLLWVEWLSVFVITVRRRPLRYLKVHSIRFQNFHTSLRSWKIYNSMEKYTINSANKISSYKWFQKMGKKIGTTSADLTYGTIETIIIYNALLPICWAPVNFVCAITFIQYYRSYINKQNNNGNNNNSGNNGNYINSNNNVNINSNKMKIHMTKFLFDIRKNWLGIQPSTLCLKIGIDNNKIYNAFQVES